MQDDHRGLDGDVTPEQRKRAEKTRDRLMLTIGILLGLLLVKAAIYFDPFEVGGSDQAYEWRP